MLCVWTCVVLIYVWKSDIYRYHSLIHQHSSSSKNPGQYQPHKIPCIFKFTYILMDLYGSKHRYVHTRQSHHGRYGNFHHGRYRLFSGSVLGVHDALHAFPKKVCVKILGFPYHWKAAPNKWEDLESFSCWLVRTQPPNQRGLACGGCHFCVVFRQGARDDDPKMGNDNRYN